MEKDTKLTTEQKQEIDRRLVSFKNGNAKSVSCEKVNTKLKENVDIKFVDCNGLSI